MLKFSIFLILVTDYFCIAASSSSSNDQIVESKRLDEKSYAPQNTRYVKRKNPFIKSKPQPFSQYVYDFNSEMANKYFESNKINKNRSNNNSNNKTLRVNKIDKKLKVPERRSADLYELQGKVSQFHSQDSNGRVSFGFNSPFQARFEERDNDGSVRGSYSYLDTNGKKIEVNYWDNGQGFHVQGNHFPTLNDLPQITQFTPEVQAARDMHFKYYDEVLASTNRFHNALQLNNPPPKVPILVPAVPDRLSLDNIILPSLVPLNDNKNEDVLLQFIDPHFGENLKTKTKQNTVNNNINTRYYSETVYGIQNKKINSNEHVQTPWQSSHIKNFEKTTNVTKPTQNIKQETIIKPDAVYEENKLSYIKTPDNNQQTKTEVQNEISKITEKPLENNSTVAVTEDKNTKEDLKINDTKNNTKVVNATNDSVSDKYDKIYDLSNAFSDISNTKIFDLSNEPLRTNVSDKIVYGVKDNYEQINNKTISRIYSITKDSADNFAQNKNQLNTLFDRNDLRFDIQPTNINETRLINSRTNNSFYYHFYHPTTSTINDKQGRSNVLNELVGVTSKRLHVSSVRKPYVRPYYYFPVVYP